MTNRRVSSGVLLTLVLGLTCCAPVAVSPESAADSTARSVAPSNSAPATPSVSAEPTHVLGGEPLAGVPPFAQLAGGPSGVCGLNDAGVWCWSRPGSESRAPEERLTGDYIGIAVHRALYTLSATGELAMHRIADASVVLGNVEPPSEFVGMQARTWSPNRAREVLCVELASIHCLQFSIEFTADHAIQQARLPESTIDWAIGPRVAIQLPRGEVRSMRSWPDEWTSRSEWPLVSLQGRSWPEPPDHGLDPAPLRTGPATLIGTTGTEFEVATAAGVFRCGLIGTDRNHPDEFACIEGLPVPQGARLSHGSLFVVPSSVDGLLDLVERGGTHLVQRARQVTFSGNDIYALARDGSVHIRTTR